MAMVDAISGEEVPETCERCKKGVSFLRFHGEWLCVGCLKKVRPMFGRE